MAQPGMSLGIDTPGKRLGVAEECLDLGTRLGEWGKGKAIYQ